MDKTAYQTRVRDDYRLVRILCFLLFSTVGMVTVAVSILSPPLAVYYADKNILHNQQGRLDQLDQLLADRRELLRHTNEPAVVERAAISNLGYQPIQAISAKVESLPRAWPELKEALARLEQQQQDTPRTPLQTFAESLTNKPLSRTLLFALGSALILLSLTCFNRSPAEPATAPH